ncbi:hypothetical protein GCM10010372_31000 [Streptomyces tauricus]|uniref:WhiB family transcriptional regulator n=1 Tax=Streptomyces tauricus TaxID=68274 RepID=UPI00167495CD|nr:WhiB family transcriptional regulator [Streptomyces tauricus]GHA28915.1 hypothetical protein GCM10010372_31000 [Streptomyces tauricus]
MEREWELRASCRFADPDIFFPPAPASEAQAICAICPVKSECLDATLDREAGLGRTGREGIFAGLTGAQRWELEKKQPAASVAKPKAKKSSTRRWNLAPCGTRAAYQRHVRNGEPIDDACRGANTEGKTQYQLTGSTQVLAAL